MRFRENGPAIPDELLVARDAGQVLFFCGAGVSTAKANLPGFLKLAGDVLDRLRTLRDSPARQLTEVVKGLQAQKIPGVGGIVAADRIFGLLEREFDLKDIEWAVGGALKPQPDASLEAHRILLSLSKGPSGKTRLVTTNFDLLFEAADPRSRRWTPSELPDFRRHADFEGIVHLHGMLDPGYREAVGGPLVLSSAEFGRAYLAESWATEFIRAAIERSRIVFVGYTADDPPVQYLLEALSRGNPVGRQELYAFQGGDAGEAAVLWKPKGVSAIAYSPKNKHAELWETLGAWAEGARNPERWRNQLLKKAARGPAELTVHERGQVAHLAATTDGARAIAAAKRPLPSEWLCVFDPAVRFGTPGYFSSDVDLFALYGIDGDPIPIKERDGKPHEIPDEAVGVLAPLPLDGDFHYTIGLDGTRADPIADIPPRLGSLARWLARVCGEPHAMWWAAGMSNLHPEVLRNVGFALDDKDNKLKPLACKVWRYLFEAGSRRGRNDSMASFELNKRISEEGWTPAIRRAVAEHFRPILTAQRPWGRLPQTGKRVLQSFGDVLSLAVGYPEEHIPIEIPDSQIKSLLPLLRTNIEQASALEQELHPREFNIPPIEPDPGLRGESSDRADGLNRQVLRFSELFRRLHDQDRDAALREFLAWPRNNHPVFGRLRIWAAGLPGRLDPESADEVLLQISNREFWSIWNQRDLLLVMARRWNELSPKSRKQIEARLRRGCPKPRGSSREVYERLRAYSIVERLSWLKSRGCQLRFNVDAEIAKFKSVIPPEWGEVDGSHAADSREGKGGIVLTDTSYDEFASTQIDVLIERAIGAREFRNDDFTERDPFAGLLKTQPLRVLAGLRRLHPGDAGAKQGWTLFLQSSAVRDDKPRLAPLIARRLAKMPAGLLEELVQPVAYWLQRTAKRLYEVDRDAVEWLLDFLTKSIAANPDGHLRKNASTGAERDWFEDAWNSTAWALGQVLLEDPRLASARSFPLAWSQRVDALLTLPDDHRRFALTQFAERLNWLYVHDQAWTERAVIASIDGEGEERDAALAGFFSNSNVSGELFLRLKPTLTRLAMPEKRPRRRREAVLSNLFITAWHAKNHEGARYLSDEELTKFVVRGSDMRTQMFRHVGGWEVGEKLTLLRDVWPRHLAVRSAAVTSRLVALAFDDEENFPAIADVIIPILSPIENRGQFLLTVPQDKQQRIFARFPRKVLELLSKILPPRSLDWPYNMGNVLTAILDSDPTLVREPKFAELRRRQAQAG